MSKQLPIYECHYTRTGKHVNASGYRYLGPLRDGSGLHQFTDAGTGIVELFAKRKHAPAAWHLERGAYRYEYVTSDATRTAIHNMGEAP